MNAIPRKVRELVVQRDESRCQACGEYCTPGWRAVHHRKRKGAGGSKLYDTVPNLVVLCHEHHRWVHDHPAQSYELGWLVRRNSVDDPESIPVDTIHGRVFLLDDGSRIPASVGADGSVTEGEA